MAKGAGYRSTWKIEDLEEFRRRWPALLREEGPVLAQLITTLADQTPMTAPGGRPFTQQVQDLRTKLLAG
jgi:hypothetical protein